MHKCRHDPCPNERDPRETYCRTCQRYLDTYGVMRRPELVIHTYLIGRGNTVSGAELASILGVTYRRVDHAARTGRITTTVHPLGTGTPRGFSVGDACGAAVRLCYADVLPEPMLAEAQRLAEQGWEPTFEAAYRNATVVLDLERLRAEMAEAFASLGRLPLASTLEEPSNA